MRVYNIYAALRPSGQKLQRGAPMSAIMPSSHVSTTVQLKAEHAFFGFQQACVLWPLRVITSQGKIAESTVGGHSFGSQASLIMGNMVEAFEVGFRCTFLINPRNRFLVRQPNVEAEQTEV